MLVDRYVYPSRKDLCVVYSRTGKYVGIKKIIGKAVIADRASAGQASLGFMGGVNAELGKKLMSCGYRKAGTVRQVTAPAGMLGISSRNAGGGS